MLELSSEMQNFPMQGSLYNFTVSLTSLYRLNFTLPYGGNNIRPNPAVRAGKQEDRWIHSLIKLRKKMFYL